MHVGGRPCGVDASGPSGADGAVRRADPASQGGAACGGRPARLRRQPTTGEAEAAASSPELPFLSREQVPGFGDRFSDPVAAA